MYEFPRYLVRDVMSRPVVVRPQTAIAEVESILEKNRFNALPKIESVRLLGSEQAFSANPSRIRVVLWVGDLP